MSGNASIFLLNDILIQQKDKRKKYRSYDLKLMLASEMNRNICFELISSDDISLFSVVCWVRLNKKRICGRQKLLIKLMIKKKNDAHRNVNMIHFLRSFIHAW